MSKQGGEGDQLYIAGYDLSGDVGSLSKVSTSAKLLDVTGINKFAHERLYGDRDGEISFSSWFNAAAGQEHAILSTLPRTDVLATYLRGSTVGVPAANLVAKQIDYKPKRGADGSLAMDVQCLANSNGLMWGRAHTAGVRTDTVATNGVAVDSLFTNTLFGGELFVHAMSIVGASVNFRLQDSADNATWADVSGLTTTIPVGVNQFAIVILPTGNTVRRYTRIITVGAFTSAVFMASFARNNAAVVF